MTNESKNLGTSSVFSFPFILTHFHYPKINLCLTKYYMKSYYLPLDFVLSLVVVDAADPSLSESRRSSLAHDP